MHPDAEKGIESISFFPAGTQPGDVPAMKISRGEERVFVWCFFLAMMEVEGWADRQWVAMSIHRRSGLKPRRPQYLRDRIDAVRPDREALRRTEDHHCHPSCRDVLHPVRLVDEGREERQVQAKTKASILSGKHGEVSLADPRYATCSSITSESFSCWSRLGKRTMSEHTTFPSLASVAGERVVVPRRRSDQLCTRTHRLRGCRGGRTEL